MQLDWRRVLPAAAHSLSLTKALRLTAGAPSSGATYGLFCVFDGHNGVACAKHTHDSLIEVRRSNPAGRAAREPLRDLPASSLPVWRDAAANLCSKPSLTVSSCPCWQLCASAAELRLACQLLAVLGRADAGRAGAGL